MAAFAPFLRPFVGWFLGSFAEEQCVYLCQHFMWVFEGVFGPMGFFSSTVLTSRSPLQLTDPTVIHLSPQHLVTRSPRANELLIWSLDSGTLLHRLSESIACLSVTGFIPGPEPAGEPAEGVEVITDFAYIPESGSVLCTIEDALGNVYTHLYDFGPGILGPNSRIKRRLGVPGREKATWRLEKRSLEWSSADGEGKGYEYPLYWVGFREGGVW